MGYITLSEKAFQSEDRALQKLNEAVGFKKREGYEAVSDVRTVAFDDFVFATQTLMK